MLTPTFKLEYNQKDITKDVSNYVVNIDYTDFESGQSDEISITFEDTEKLWQSAWIPSKGDSLRLYIGYLGEKLLNCGIFEIDEIEFETPPDTLTVKARTQVIKVRQLRHRMGVCNDKIKRNYIHRLAIKTQRNRLCS